MEPTAIQKVVEGIINADNNADLNAVLSFYSDEAILLPPREPPIKGLKGIEENYRNIFANSFLDLKVQIDTIQVSRDLAVCRGQLGTIT